MAVAVGGGTDARRPPQQIEGSGGLAAAAGNPDQAFERRHGFDVALTVGLDGDLERPDVALAGAVQISLVDQDVRQLGEGRSGCRVVATVGVGPGVVGLLVGLLRFRSLALLEERFAECLALGGTDRARYLEDLARRLPAQAKVLAELIAVGDSGDPRLMTGAARQPP